MKRIFAALLIPGLLLCLSACREPQTEESTTGGYVYTPTQTTEADHTSSLSGEEVFHTDASWQENFDLTYRIFDASQGKTPVTVNEKKGASLFVAEYLETGNILYYVQNESNIDQYILSPAQLEGTHSVLRGKRISGISSTFMKLSEVSAELPSYSNVLYMKDELVAGRMCKKYIQRAYQDGEAQETVYVWVDAEYGFAAKGEDYDKDDELTLSWELTSFSVGTVEDETAKIDLGIYQIKEAE